MPLPAISIPCRMAPALPSQSGLPSALGSTTSASIQPLSLLPPLWTLGGRHFLLLGPGGFATCSLLSSRDGRAQNGIGCQPPFNLYFATKAYLAPVHSLTCADTFNCAAILLFMCIKREGGRREDGRRLAQRCSSICHINDSP
jgi:hypothetical protein